MDTDNTGKILTKLIKIERALSRLYHYFSEIENFSSPVKRFWSTLAEEEEKHALLFESIARRLQSDSSFKLSLLTDAQRLSQFVDQLNGLIREVKKNRPSEKEAYSLGARIEAELYEAGFLKDIKSNDVDLKKTLTKIDVDTKKHNMLLVAYIKGHA